MYSARISRNTPTAIIILIDQSGSMADKVFYEGEEISKAEAVASIVNMLICELINRSTREDGVRDYFDMAIYGYNGENVTSMLPSKNGHFMTLSKLAENVRSTIKVKRERILPDGSSTVSIIDRKVWVEAVAKDLTPMYTAFKTAYNIVKQWCEDPRHRMCYPPTIFNISDGEASDGDRFQLTEIAQRIKETKTDDGNTILVNIHISGGNINKPIIFAGSRDELPSENKYAELLYNMSSILPEIYNKHITEISGKQGGEFRAIGLNAAMTDLVNIMNIGSVSANIID